MQKNSRNSTSHRYPNNIKVALVCDWITNPGGDDKVIWALHKLFSQAPIFTTVYNRQKMPHYKNADIRTTYLQKIPLAQSKHQFFVPLMFSALRRHDLSGFDIIISSSHTVGKSITKPKKAIHICYCHTPLRYIWAPNIDDIRRRIPLGPLTKPLMQFLKKRDLESARSVDKFIANSRTIAERIQKAYVKKAIVVYPPVDVTNFTPVRVVKKSNYYLTASRLIPYKKIDVIIKAFNLLGYELRIAGAGPEINHLKKIAKPNIKFLGYVPNLVSLIQKAKAFVFAAEEDFGIVPVEAMAAGTPVIAYGKGGSAETIVENSTGIFFDKQTPQAIMRAVKVFEKKSFNADNCIKQSQKFDKNIFDKKIVSLIKSLNK